MQIAYAFYLYVSSSQAFYLLVLSGKKSYQFLGCVPLRYNYYCQYYYCYMIKIKIHCFLCPFILIVFIMLLLISSSVNDLLFKE